MRAESVYAEPSHCPFCGNCNGFDTLRSEVFFPLQETFDLIGIAWDIQNDVLSMACQYHIEADYGKDQPHLCSINMQTLQVYAAG